MSVVEIQTRNWSRQEYEQLVSAGIFQPHERLELVEGEILQMSPQGSAHATAITLIDNALREVFGSNYTIRVQMPLAVSLDSEPEPDIAVVVGSPRDYRDTHPTTAELVVEVADTTLAYDRERKAALYARAGIQEYWILNVIDRQLEIYRQPMANQPSPPSYKIHHILTSSESVSPLPSPQTELPVHAFLP